MKVVTVFMLSVVLALCYCWTAQGHYRSGKKDDKKGLAKMIQHKDVHGLLQPGRRLATCNCEHINPHHLQRKRRHMTGRRQHGAHTRHCSMVCKRNSPHKAIITMPLS